MEKENIKIFGNIDFYVSNKFLMKSKRWGWILESIRIETITNAKNQLESEEELHLGISKDRYQFTAPDVNDIDVGNLNYALRPARSSELFA